jgi:hypothetical protein
MLVRSQGLGWLAVFPRPARVAPTYIQNFDLFIWFNFAFFKRHFDFPKTTAK